MCKIVIKACVTCKRLNMKPAPCPDTELEVNKTSFKAVVDRTWMIKHTSEDPNVVVTTIDIISCPSCPKRIPNLSAEHCMALTDAIESGTSNILGKFVLKNASGSELMRWSKRSFSSPETDTEYETETDVGTDVEVTTTVHKIKH